MEEVVRNKLEILTQLSVQLHKMWIIIKQRLKMEVDLKKIQLSLEQVLDEHAEFCFLLGSAATPRFRQDSDIDIAIFWKDDDVKFEFKLKLINELEEKLGHDIDLITLNNIDVIYGIQVIDTGRLLINNNPGLLLQWKAVQLSRYPDFKASRSIIEKNILNRKKYVRD